MAQYIFACHDCEESFELTFSMNDDEGRDNATCPNCNKKLKRVFTAPYAIVKNPAAGYSGSSFQNTVKQPDQHFVDVDGKPIKMNFIDPGDHREESRAIEEATGMKGVHTDPETGQKCVKVVSNVPDPLGKIDEAKKKADRVETEVRHINQKTKVRK